MLPHEELSLIADLAEETDRVVKEAYLRVINLLSDYRQDEAEETARYFFDEVLQSIQSIKAREQKRLGND